MPFLTTIQVDERLLESARLLSSKIGNTPLYRVTQLFTKPQVTIYAKQEWKQLSGSVKARAGYNIFKTAIEKASLPATSPYWMLPVAIPVLPMQP
ncbi:hypothetical protein [Paraflavitalea speifideaquila]|uniref:hypothetical protein n=1 Tax=Paraflavitalea speifideaquila TaxID=3076558 RepID=UPI0028E5A319|nr:hypothetical protein [Paraflavitalea speifideiaquila]